MNSKEALKDLREVKGWNDVEFNKRLDIIEKDLQRNEAMKPLLKDMGFEHYDIYCPSCKEYIGYRNSVRQSLTLKYCPDCGQAIDWSDEVTRL